MKIKKISSLLCGVLLITSLAGCGQIFSPAMTIDGTEITGGMYLLQQYNAYDKAKSKVEDTTVDDILNEKVDDISAKTWIHDKTLETSREYVAVQKLSEEYGVTLSDEDIQYIESSLANWDTNGSYEAYAENGIGKDTFYDYLENQMLKSNLFNKLYKEEGDNFVSDEALKQLYNEKYADIESISIPLFKPDGTNKVDDETKARIEEATKKLVDELQSGQKTPEDIRADVGNIYAISGSTFDAETNATFSSSQILLNPTEEDTNSYSEDFLKALAQEPVGTYGMTLVDDSSASVYEFVLYRKIDALSNEEDFAQKRDSLLQDLKQDDFEELLKTTGDDYPVKQRFLSEWYYNPKNIVYFSRGSSTSTATQ